MPPARSTTIRAATIAGRDPERQTDGSSTTSRSFWGRRHAPNGNVNAERGRCLNGNFSSVFLAGFAGLPGRVKMVLNQCGLDALAECHLGTRQNRHQPLRALGEMAFAVLAAVENRIQGPRSPTGGHYLRPWENGAVIQVPIDERPPLRSLVHQAT